MTSEKGSIDESDGSHIIYVNGTITNDGTEIDNLIHDLLCKNFSEMHDGPLKDRMSYLQSEEGEKEVNKELAKVLAEENAKKSKEIAERMLNKNLSTELVAECTALPIEQVEEIRNNLK